MATLDSLRFLVAVDFFMIFLVFVTVVKVEVVEFSSIESIAKSVVSSSSSIIDFPVLFLSFDDLEELEMFSVT